MWMRHETHYCAAPVYHPRSVGMVERAMQLTTSVLQKGYHAEEKERRRSTKHRDAFKEGDLVLVQDLKREKISKNKMTPKWFGPRKLVKINPSRATAQEDFHYSGATSAPDAALPLDVKRSAISMALLLGQRSVDGYSHLPSEVKADDSPEGITDKDDEGDGDDEAESSDEESLDDERSETEMVSAQPPASRKAIQDSLSQGYSGRPPTQVEDGGEKEEKGTTGELLFRE
ncbi:hypothetical protein N7501_006041 [Penicillium viridicatum]|nr:hypothetical protein N7501_006041 [Penicillium viridicatum]